MWRAMAGGVIGVLACASVALAQERVPRALADEVVKAWTKAGAKVGWREKGTWFLRPSDYKPKPGDLPALMLLARVKESDELIAAWQALPDPGVPFALSVGNGCTDPLVKSLSHLESLHFLELGTTWLTDAGLEHLAQLQALHTLQVSGNKITNAGLLQLSKLPALRRLDVHSNAITDAGLKYLRACDTLEELDLWGQQLTKPGVAALRKALPKTTISLYVTKVEDPK